MTTATATLGTLRDAEKNALTGGRSFFTGKGKPKEEPSQKNTFKNLRRRGAIVTILAFLFGGGLFLANSNSLLINAFSSRFSEVTDIQHASASVRSVRLLSFYLNNTGATATIFPGVKRYTHMSEDFIQRLADQGITIEGTGSNKTLTYTRTAANGSTEVISGITANDFNKVYHENANLRNAYNNAKYNRAGLYYDNTAMKVLGTKLGITRNTLKDFQQTNDAAADQKRYREILSEKLNGDTTEVRTSAYYEEERVNEDGETYIYRDKAESEITMTSGETDAEAATRKARELLADVGSSTVMIQKSQSALAAISYPCMIMRVGNMISMLVAANEIYKAINFFASNSESISKAMSGQGSTSAINETLNFLTTSVTTEVEDLGNVQITGTGEDMSGSSGTLVQTGAPVQANGMQVILSGASVDPQTTKNYSIERVAASTITALATSGITMNMCAGADLAGSVLSIGVEIISGGLSKVATNIAGRVIYGTLLAGTVTAVFSFLIPTIKRAVISDVVETAIGIPGGEMTALGGIEGNGQLARRGSGFAIASEEKAEAYNHVTNTVLALDAEVDRLNYSPFDITNPNTFFGSIAYSLLPVTTSSSISNISSLLKSTASSLSSLMGSVQASGEGSSLMTSYGDCNNLNSIGAAGNLYCTPILAMDTTLMDMSPDDPTYQQRIMESMEPGSCDENDGSGCKIDEHSDLAKYVSLCDGRDSPFGVADQNILTILQPTNPINAALYSFLVALPFVGDLMTLAESGADIENMDWAIGEKCGMTKNNAEWWNNYGRYYQRYVEDTRLLENVGAFTSDSGAATTNPITAYEEAYEAAHPTDNSYVGYLSRISGLTPTNVEVALTFIDYFQYLDEYDPTSRIALASNDLLHHDSAEVVAHAEQALGLHFDDAGEEATISVPTQHIIYADVRNRTYIS